MYDCLLACRLRRLLPCKCFRGVRCASSLAHCCPVVAKSEARHLKPQRIEPGSGALNPNLTKRSGNFFSKDINYDSTISLPVANSPSSRAYRIPVLYNAILHPNTPTPHQVRQHYIRE